MALGKHREEQQEMWVATTSLPKSVGHVFYRKLNRLLAEAEFDRTVEKMCEPYYHNRLGRPSIPPGVYFRMLLVGYYEGIGSQRGIAWRCADSLSLREFLRVPLTEDTPDHSSLSSVCGANWWKGVSRMSATPAVLGGVGCMGSKRFKSVT